MKKFVSLMLSFALIMPSAVAKGKAENNPQIFVNQTFDSGATNEIPKDITVNGSVNNRVVENGNNKVKPVSNIFHLWEKKTDDNGEVEAFDNCIYNY